MLKRTKLLFTIFCGLSTLFSFGQSPQIDSLTQLLKTAKEDTNKVNILNGLGREYYNIGDYTNSLNVSLSAKKLSTSLGYKRGLGNAYTDIGIVYDEQGNYPEALKNYSEALKTQKEINDLRGMGVSYINLGILYTSQENYAEALKQYYEGLKIMEKVGDKLSAACAYGNLGGVYHSLGNSKEALKNHFEALKYFTEIGNRKEMASSYTNIGNVYHRDGKNEEALKHYMISLKVKKEIGDKKGLATCLTNIGNVYNDQQKHDEALKTYFEALKIREEMGEKRGISRLYGNLGRTYKFQKKYKDAEEYSLKALKLAQEIGRLEVIKEAHENLSLIYTETGRYKEALTSFQAAILAKDSLVNQEKTKKTIQAQLQYEFDKKDAAVKLEQEKKDAAADAEKRKQQVITAAVTVGLFLVLILAGVILRSLRINQKKNAIIEYQKKLVEEKHKEITDSINYAERIQRNFLAAEDVLEQNISEYFIFFQPKDVVSGDFYWAGKLSNGSFALITADSTGHGVPGAIMSILNIYSLEKAVEDGLTDPSEILNHTRKNIIERLKRGDSNEGGKDGMDCSIVNFDPSKNKITYAGANNPIWIVRNSTISEYAPDKMPVGKNDLDKISFKQQTIDLQKGDMIYTLTDGMADQFGGPKGKKFMYRQLKELLVSVAHLPVTEQRKKIEEVFIAWKGNLEQVDDVTVIGVRV